MTIKNKPHTVTEYAPIVNHSNELLDGVPYPITLEMADAFLKYQQASAKSGYSHSFCIDAMKYVFSIAVGVANTILFDEVTNAFAKEYLNLDLLGQNLFSFSSCYANFFLSVYTSLKLIELYIESNVAKQILQTVVNIKPKKNSKQIYRFSIITGISFITSIPTMAPLADSTEQLLTLFSNVLMYMYALYEFHAISTADANSSIYFENIKTSIVQFAVTLNIESLKSNPKDLLTLFNNFQNPIEKPPIIISNAAYAYAMFSAISVVTPFFMAMTQSMNDPNADNGFLNYLLVNNKSLRLFVAIITSFITEAVFFILSAYFGYKTVYDIHDMFTNTTRVGKQHYPTLWWTLKVLQSLITSLSWSTGVKLFLDFFGGPQFSGYSAKDMIGIYTSAVFIAIGIYSFNVYSNLQLIDIYMEKFISLFGDNDLKQKLELIDLTNKLQFITQYSNENYQPKLRTQSNSTFSKNQRNTMWSMKELDHNYELTLQTDDAADEGTQTMTHKINEF